MLAMTDPQPAGVLGVWLNDADLAEACRARADELAMSYEEIDRIAGLASGHASKVLSVPQQQGFGPVSRFTIPWALRMKFGLIDAPEHTRNHVRRITRAVRKGKRHHRNTKALALIEKWGSDGGRKRFKNMTQQEVSEYQSRTAKARWRKYRRALRETNQIVGKVLTEADLRAIK